MKGTEHHPTTTRGETDLGFGTFAAESAKSEVRFATRGGEGRPETPHGSAIARTPGKADSPTWQTVTDFGGYCYR